VGKLPSKSPPKISGNIYEKIDTTHKNSAKKTKIWGKFSKEKAH